MRSRICAWKKKRVFIVACCCCYCGFGLGFVVGKCCGQFRTAARVCPKWNSILERRKRKMFDLKKSFDSKTKRRSLRDANVSRQSDAVEEDSIFARLLCALQSMRRQISSAKKRPTTAQTQESAPPSLQRRSRLCEMRARAFLCAGLAQTRLARTSLGRRTKKFPRKRFEFRNQISNLNSNFFLYRCVNVQVWLIVC